MKINIKGIKIFKSKTFYDNRGFFKEVYKKKLLANKKLIFFIKTLFSIKKFFYY